jgi:hypothetical protein
LGKELLTAKVGKVARRALSKALEWIGVRGDTLEYVRGQTPLSNFRRLVQLEF